MDLSFTSGSRMLGGKYSKDNEKIRNKESEHISVKYKHDIFFDDSMKFESWWREDCDFNSPLSGLSNQYTGSNKCTNSVVLYETNKNITNVTNWIIIYLN